LFIVAAMRPFLVTELQAGKLPRWGLLLLCLLYIVPGFVGRDPWRYGDAAGFGVALTMARGDASDWLLPNIAGEPVYDEGPLPFWVGAAVARLLPFVSEHTAARSATAAGIALLFVAFWYAVYSLSKRPGLMPSDPFGASATRVDFGRAIADSALLVLMATLGVIARVHETTGQAAQLTIGAFFLFGAATALYRPTRGGLIAGVAIGATVMTRGLLPAFALAACAAALPLVSRDYRLVAARWLATTLLTGTLIGLAWPLALLGAGQPGTEHLAGWLAWNRAQLTGPTLDSAQDIARTLPWYFWPAWPMAFWALYRWRGRIGEPAVALPLTSLATGAVVALVLTEAPDDLLLRLALPLAMLAAAGLPTLARSVVSLLDWFAVMTYSVISFVVWAYWIAFVTGFPPRMAASARRIAPGFEPDWIVVDIALGVLATVGWALLVRWRVSRQPPMLWRAVVLSSSGLVVAWFLLMTLWLPVFNVRNTYRDVSRQAASALGDRYDCVETERLGRAQRASLQYFGNFRFGAADRSCGWRIVQDEGPLARTQASVEPGWRLVWEGSRPHDDDERLRLYQRLR
jgi:4-amino-4-deoxy-L-arabinose transferase-like glycosyltransferase